MFLLCRKILSSSCTNENLGFVLVDHWLAVRTKACYNRVVRIHSLIEHTGPALIALRPEKGTQVRTAHGNEQNRSPMKKRRSTPRKAKQRATTGVASRSMIFERNENGEPRQIVSATLDITERKRVEQALRASDERFRRYFELGLIGMAITSPAKGCIEFNDEICKILGYERDELLRMTWAELTHPDDLAADVANFERVWRGRTTAIP